jgi:hypothetical protein
VVVVEYFCVCARLHTYVAYLSASDHQVHASPSSSLQLYTHLSRLPHMAICSTSKRAHLGPDEHRAHVAPHSIDHLAVLLPKNDVGACLRTCVCECVCVHYISLLNICIYIMSVMSVMSVMLLDISN